ncbi:N-acetylmuramoyl-L-alanine amidase [Clostridioides difficile]|nr:N-acetylmuramoyl-L-alanine amidase [Clostridioides difficile]MDI6385202.1 N-acetylmuramoyl-L-alanine amidase [Clostridioides difficile]HBG2429418.1 N-acetylmuramoyl-L-alanine amidase [Clostridioides difficile]
MKICVSVGHSLLKSGSTTSADGNINEYLYNKALAPYLSIELQKIGHSVDVVICPEKKFKTKDEEPKYKLPLINSKSYDLVIELHLNCYNKVARGTTVLYVSKAGKQYAEKIQSTLSTAFYNRKTTRRQDLYMLTKTKAPAIMIESFFCDNDNDCKIARSLGFTGVAKLIATGLKDNSLKPKSEIKSIVDYMKSVNLDSSFNNRRILASKFGIKDYKGTESQNIKLLEKIRTL